jgi:hypothetical protein
MTDWGHNSAFEAIWPTSSLEAPSILLNGVVSTLVLSAAFRLPLTGERYTLRQQHQKYIFYTSSVHTQFRFSTLRPSETLPFAPD